MRATNELLIKKSRSTRVGLLICLCASLFSCKTRTQNSEMRSLDSTTGSDTLVATESLQLLTREGRQAADFFSAGQLVGAVYIGQVGYVKAKESRSGNSSFFEKQTLEQILKGLPGSAQENTTAPYFNLVGCKERQIRSFVTGFERVFKGNLNEIKDAFMPNYARVFETEELLPSVEEGCVDQLKNKEQTLTFEFYLKPELDQNGAVQLGSLRQVLIVGSNRTERKAVFESKNILPAGQVLVVLRNDSYGNSAPQVAVLPTDRPFTEKEKSDALYALGWTGDYLRTMRENSPILEAISKRPSNLVELSARFQSFRHYARIADAGVRTMEYALIPVGVAATAGALPALGAALQVAMVTHSFSSAATVAGAALPVVTGASSAVKAWCDATEFQKRKDLADPKNVLIRIENAGCFVSNILFAVSMVSNAAFTTPGLRDFLVNGLRSSFEASAAAAASSGLDLTDPAQIEAFRTILETHIKAFEALYAKLQLGLTNAPLVRSLTLRTLNNILGQSRAIRDNAPKAQGLLKEAGGFIGQSYGMPLEQLMSQCPTKLDIQVLRFGQNPLTNYMVLWKNCFAFMRKAWAKVSQDDDFWEMQAQIKTNAQFPPEALIDQVKQVNVRSVNAADLKRQALAANGPLFLRSASEQPWNSKEGSEQAYQQMTKNLREDLEICAEAIASNPKICKDKGNDCLLKCGASALHKFRNEFWPADFFSCLSKSAAERSAQEYPHGCVVEYDDNLDSGDNIEMKSALQAGSGN